MFASFVEERKCKTSNSGMAEDEQYFCVGCPDLKKVRSPLLCLIEKAQPGFVGLQDHDK